MVELKEIVEIPLEGLRQTLPEVNMTPLDHLEADGVNIHCINSSEFVVGKQTNFNGPVTIINCANAYREEINVEDKGEDEKAEKEKIVIREKVLSKSATKKVQEMAKKTETPQKSTFSEKLKSGIKKSPLHRLAIPAFIFIALAITAAIIVTVISNNPQSEDISNNQSCIHIPRLSREACIYSEFDLKDCNVTDRSNFTESSFLQHPLPFVVVTQTGGDFCYTQEDCLLKYQTYKCERYDEKCNFLVSPEGHFYEDRGWNLTNSQTGPTAGKSLVICFIGHFSNFEYPTFPQTEATKALIHYGEDNGYLAKNYVLLPGNATDKNDKLGSVYKIIKKWKNFREIPFENTGENQTISVQPSSKEGHIIYSKEDWGGEPPTSKIEMQTPVPYVVISHTVTPRCTSLQTCSSLIKNMQSYHFSREMADIFYNFLVDSGGNIYEGRGWSTRNSRGGFVNGRSLDVAFIGDFSKKVEPTEKQADGVQFLIEFGVLNGKIADDYILLAANFTFTTLSPGKQVYKIIKQWPHFDPNPLEHIPD